MTSSIVREVLENVLKNLGLYILEFILEQLLCLLAIGAPTLGEDDNRVVADSRPRKSKSEPDLAIASGTRTLTSTISLTSGMT